jgi:hypothetical protein
MDILLAIFRLHVTKWFRLVDITNDMINTNTQFGRSALSKSSALIRDIS